MSRLLARLLALLLWAGPGIAFAQDVNLQFEQDDPQSQYAAGRLVQALEEREHGARANRKRVVPNFLALDQRGLKPEAFAIAPANRSLTIRGGDGRGLIYGVLSVAEKLRNGTALTAIGSETGAALAHFNPPNNGRTENNLFHWARLKPPIARDLEVAKAATFHSLD